MILKQSNQQMTSAQSQNDQFLAWTSLFKFETCGADMYSVTGWHSFFSQAI